MNRTATTTPATPASVADGSTGGAGARGGAGLELRDVRLTYPDGDSRLVALDDVSVDVRQGELLAVTGPSGSGKSSLLAVAGLLQTVDSGRVLVGGKDLTDAKANERTQARRELLGFVFQQSNLIASLTALEQLLVVRHLAGGIGKGDRDVAMALLDSVGLAAQAGRRPHQLSGGQRQRVAIARALVNEPRVLLVDEPTSALDAERGHAIVELLAQVTRERSVATLMVTHDLAQLDVANAVVEIHDGALTHRGAAG